ncbi:MAG: MgtC/SapB family protein [Minisyncoccia bacterium]
MMPEAMMAMFGKILLAAFLGMLIGTERSVVARRSAGMRTFALVSLGACIFTLTGVYVDAQYIGVINFDPMRIAAAIVQGVGFIGAGLMFAKGDSVHGVTTAAGLWVAAAVGVLVGFGIYPLAIFASALTVVILFGLWYVEHKFMDWYHGNEAE